MYPQVALQRLQVAEARAADVTRVRFLSSVDQYVSPQMSHLGNQKEEDEAPQIDTKVSLQKWSGSLFLPGQSESRRFHICMVFPLSGSASVSSDWQVC